MKKLFFLFLFFCLLPIAAHAQSVVPITFEESDGSPKITMPSRIKVPNGSMSVSGRTITLTFGTGTVTHTVGNLTLNDIIIGNGSADLKASGVQIGNVPLLNAANNFSAAQTVTETGLATTSTDGSTLRNTTASTAIVPVQQSPRFRLTATAWSPSDGISEPVDFIQELVPVSDDVPTVTVNWKQQVNSGGYVTAMSLTGGTLYTLGNLTPNGSIYSGHDVFANSTDSIGWTPARAKMQSPADGKILLLNSGGTDFSLLQFGKTDNTRPALKPSSTSLKVRLADDSADAPLTALTFNGLTITTTTGTVTITNGKTLSVSNSLTLAGTDGSTLNVGAGGTLGSNAFTSTAYAPIASPTFTGTPSGPSYAITGTAGAGFEEYPTQSSAPSAPASGFREYADSTGRKSWIRASDGFTRTWDATLTANRVYTLPDANSTFPVFSQVVTFSGPTAARTVTLPDANFTAARTDAAQTFTGAQSLTSPKITTGIDDTNGNQMFKFTATSSAVDGLTFTNAATANPATVTMSATGSDSNIEIALTPKGTGRVIAATKYTISGAAWNLKDVAGLAFEPTSSGQSAFRVLSSGEVRSGGAYNFVSGSLDSISPDSGLARVTGKVVSASDGSTANAGWFTDAGIKRVSTQFDKTSDTTLANVTGLSVTVQAGRTYSFVAELFTSSNVAGGVQAAIAGTATATAIVYDGVTLNAAAVGAQTRATALGTAVGATTTVTAAHITITGVITVNAAGTLTVQFAQNASNGAASSVLVGSYFIVRDNP